MKNKILILITLASVADFVTGAFLLSDDKYWEIALTALLLSAFWICSFLVANQERFDRWCHKMVEKIQK